MGWALQTVSFFLVLRLLFLSGHVMVLVTSGIVRWMSPRARQLGAKGLGRGRGGGRGCRRRRLRSCRLTRLQLVEDLVAQLRLHLRLALPLPVKLVGGRAEAHLEIRDAERL